MNVLGIRFCSVSPEARELAQFFGALGMPKLDMGSLDVEIDEQAYEGAIFPAGTSWVEIWQPGPDMPVGIMLQVVVDDADAFAAHARTRGLEPQRPMDAHGEHIYFIEAPGGLQVSFQSKLPTSSD